MNGGIAQTQGDESLKDRNIQTDFRGAGFQLIRTVTATDAPFNNNPGAWKVTALANNVFLSRGCKNFNIRLSGVNGASPVVHLRAWPFEGPVLNSATGARSVCKGESIFIATFTLSGSSCVNMNPFTGATTSATSVEASDYSASYEMSARVKRLTSAAATSRELVMQVDAQGYEAFYFEVTDISTANPLFIACKRVD